MAVKIRLQRGGAKHKPMYRMVVADSRSKRDGRFIEIIGAYDPKNKIEGKQVKVDLDRAAYWVSVGAQPSDTARTIINRAKREAAARGPGEEAAAKPAAEKPAAKPAASKADVLGGDKPAAPRTTPTETDVAEGDAASAAGEIASDTPAPAEPAEKEAREVAERSADASPTGEPVAGTGESGATAIPPQEAEEAAREEEDKK